MYCDCPIYVMEVPSNLKLEMEFIVPLIRMYCNVGYVGNVDNNVSNIDIKGCPSKTKSAEKNLPPVRFQLKNSGK